MKNGHQIIETNVTGIAGDAYPPLLFSNPIYTDQGIYQCMVFIEGVGFITSPTRDVQFEGNKSKVIKK